MLHLRHCSIQWEDYGARLVFPGGKEISAWPHPEQPHYHVISHRCGYGDDLLAYCREHELAHIVSAELFRGGPSPVLYALAHGEPVDQGLAVWEELTAMALQRWVRANERPIVGNVDWDQVKATFIGYAAQLDGALVCRAA